MHNQKIFYCASTTGHLRNFHLPYIRQLTQQGAEVTICSNTAELLPFAKSALCIHFAKSITSPKNLWAILQLRKHFLQNQYDIISVHTTLAATLVRIAVLLLPKQKRPHILYTCHGYLFSEQDSWHKWKYLLPEQLCARVTDVLAVMNAEDARLAQKYRLYRHRLYIIPGMGVDYTRFAQKKSKEILRTMYGYPNDAVIFLFAGEFSRRKNQVQLIEAFSKVHANLPHTKLILAGDGSELTRCQILVKEYGLQGAVEFPGQVANMVDYYYLADICVSASKSEGLPFNIMESMYCGLPCIVSKVKGHTDLITEQRTGRIFRTTEELVACMQQLATDKQARIQYGSAAREAATRYALEQVKADAMKIYEE